LEDGGCDMPTIIRQDGFKVVIYPNDHMPSHVHVLKDDEEVRIDLGSIDTENGKPLILPSIISVSRKIGDKEIAKALSLVQKHQAMLLVKWSEIHGE
jgi:Domain of unknown function (DUF4160)